MGNDSHIVMGKAIGWEVWYNLILCHQWGYVGTVGIQTNHLEIQYVCRMWQIDWLSWIPILH